MKSLLPTLSYSLVIIGMHLSIMFSFLADQNLNLLLGIHIFLLVFLIAGQLIIKKIKSVDPEKIGMAFLAITVFKMLFSMLFIFLVYKFFDIPKFVLIGNFFAAFFAYLIFEVVVALKELR